MKKLSVLIFLLSLMLFFTCDMQRVEPESLYQDGPVTVKSKASIETPLELTGVMHFYVYAIKEDHLVVDSKLPMIATLTHIAGQNYLLETKEYTPPQSPMPGMLYRTMIIEVKITPGGQVKFSWPEVWWELPGAHPDGMAAQVALHTGYDLHGPGINKGTLDYKGSFDGEDFYAKWHWTGKQLAPGTFGPYIQMVDGIIKLEFSIELSVD